MLLVEGISVSWNRGGIYSPKLAQVLAITPMRKKHGYLSRRSTLSLQLRRSKARGCKSSRKVDDSSEHHWKLPSSKTRVPQRESLCLDPPDRSTCSHCSNAAPCRLFCVHTRTSRPTDVFGSSYQWLGGPPPTPRNWNLSILSSITDWQTSSRWRGEIFACPASLTWWIGYQDPHNRVCQWAQTFQGSMQASHDFNSGARSRLVGHLFGHRAAKEGGASAAKKGRLGQSFNPETRSSACSPFFAQCQPLGPLSSLEVYSCLDSGSETGRVWHV